MFVLQTLTKWKSIKVSQLAKDVLQTIPKRNIGLLYK